LVLLCGAFVAAAERKRRRCDASVAAVRCVRPHRPRGRDADRPTLMA
jgi:hypothetical protein